MAASKPDKFDFDLYIQIGSLQLKDYNPTIGLSSELVCLSETIKCRLSSVVEIKHKQHWVGLKT